MYYSINGLANHSEQENREFKLNRSFYLHEYTKNKKEEFSNVNKALADLLLDLFISLSQEYDNRKYNMP
jgi:hypothetical protein